MALGAKVANALAPGILGLILSQFGWLETKEGMTEQLEVALHALQISVTILPAIIMGIAILGLVFVYRNSLEKFIKTA